LQIKQQLKERAQQAAAGNSMPLKKPAVEEDQELEEKIEL